MGIRALREEQAWSLQDLAREAGVSVDTIIAAEHGRRVLRPSSSRKIAAALGVTPRDLKDDRARYLVAGQRVPEGCMAMLVEGKG